MGALAQLIISAAVHERRGKATERVNHGWSRRTMRTILSVFVLLALHTTQAGRRYPYAVKVQARAWQSFGTDYKWYRAAFFIILLSFIFWFPVVVGQAGKRGASHDG